MKAKEKERLIATYNKLLKQKLEMEKRLDELTAKLRLVDRMLMHDGIPFTPSDDIYNPLVYENQ